MSESDGGEQVRIEEYGPVDGSKPANVHLRRLRYQGSSGVRSPEGKAQASLVTADVEGAAVLPPNMLKTQLGGGRGAWRKAARPRRHVGVTNQVKPFGGCLRTWASWLVLREHRCILAHALHGAASHHHLHAPTFANCASLGLRRGDSEQPRGGSTS